MSVDFIFFPEIANVIFSHLDFKSLLLWFKISKKYDDYSKSLEFQGLLSLKLRLSVKTDYTLDAILKFCQIKSRHHVTIASLINNKIFVLFSTGQIYVKIPILDTPERYYNLNGIKEYGDLILLDIPDLNIIEIQCVSSGLIALTLYGYIYHINVETLNYQLLVGVDNVASITVPLNNGIVIIKYDGTVYEYLESLNIIADLKNINRMRIFENKFVAVTTIGSIHLGTLLGTIDRKIVAILSGSIAYIADIIDIFIEDKLILLLDSKGRIYYRHFIRRPINLERIKFGKIEDFLDIAEDEFPSKPIRILGRLDKDRLPVVLLEDKSVVEFGCDDVTLVNKPTFKRTYNNIVDIALVKGSSHRLIMLTTHNTLYVSNSGNI